MSEIVLEKSLSDNEVYAVTAYLLNLNGIIGENDEMNVQTLPKVTMPNRSNFIIMYPSRGEVVVARSVHGRRVIGGLDVRRSPSTGVLVSAPRVHRTLRSRERRRTFTPGRLRSRASPGVRPPATRPARLSRLETVLTLSPFQSGE
jgi:hypothetical protein